MAHVRAKLNISSNLSRTLAKPQTVIFAVNFSALKRFIKILRNSALVLVIVLVTLGIVINQKPVQQYLVGKAAQYLANTLQTEVSIERISIDFFDQAVLSGVLIRDLSKDTLLYAGEARVNITDWFFLKEKPVISFVGLKDAVVNINRSRRSDVWNFQFIVDAFASNEVKKKKDTTNSNPQFNLRKIDLNNVRFNMIDAWYGADYITSVKRFKVKINDIDTRQKSINVASIEGDEVLIGMTDYKGGKPPSPRRSGPPPIDKTPFNPDNWKVIVSEMALKNSRYYLDYPDAKPAIAGYFDETHLDVRHINVSIKKIVIVGDTIKGKVQHMSCVERCGIEVRDMQADVKVSPNISECKNLKLRTAHSYLTDYYAMKYERFPDFLDYINKVSMEGVLTNGSEVGIQDIVYFAPELKRFSPVSVRITGKGGGTVSHLSARDIQLFDGISSLTGNIMFKGLPEIEETFMEADIQSLKTNGAGVYVYVPELRSQEALSLSALEQVNFSGNFKGLISAFEAAGNVQTNLGNATANVSMKLPIKGQTSYAGNISTQQFDIGRLFNQDYLGKVSADLAVSGKDFDLKKGAIGVNGTISEAEVIGYNYKDVQLNGAIAAKQFKGKLQSKDVNFLLDFDGKIDYSGTQPLFDFNADVAQINAGILGWTKDSLILKGKAKINFAGNSIDAFDGYASMEQLEVRNNGRKLNFDYLKLLSQQTSNGGKQLQLHTNGLSANVEGNFLITELPGSVQMFLAYYLPQYVQQPKQMLANQQLRFNVAISDADDLVSIFDKNLKFGANAFCRGNLNVAQQQLNVEVKVPELQYAGLHFKDLFLLSDGGNTGLNLTASLGSVVSNDNALISTLNFNTKLFNDTATFDVTTTTPTTLGSATLNGVAFAANDSFFLSILPSQFYFNQNKWDILNGNQTVFAKDFMAINNLVLQSGFQSIGLNRHKRVISEAVLLDVKDLNVAPVNELLGLDALSLEGNISGTIQANSLLKNQQLSFDFLSSNLKNKSRSIGELHAVGMFDVPLSTLSLSNQTKLEGQNYTIGLNGFYIFDQHVDSNLNAQFNFSNADLSLLQPFVDGYLQKLTGNLDGQVTLSGRATAPVTSGFLSIGNAGFVPEIIGPHYHIEKADIAVNDKKFDLGKITVTDDEGNKGILSGAVLHNGFDKLSFRLGLSSDNIKVLDLEDYQNPYFYGKVNASVQMRLSGPVNNLNLNIFAIPLRNSSLQIPIDYSGDVSTYDYIKFKQVDKEDIAGGILKNRDKYNIRIDAIATPDLETTIILDPVSKDKITAKGSGNISLEIPSEGDMKMNGVYTIDEGIYDFSFKQLQVLNFQKQFAIVPGSVIKWNGDLADADLDVSANAQVKARLYDLIVNEVERAGLSPQEVKDAQLSQMVNVNVQMKGSLDEPDLHFKLDLVENRSIGTYAYQRLQRVNSDDKELVNQVASLLILEQFIPPEGFSNSGAVRSGAVNNMSEVISTTASSQITNIANKVLGLEDLYIGVRYKNYNLADTVSLGDVNYMNRNEARLNLRKNFLKGRLIIEMGGIYDWGRANAQSDFTTSLAGDFRVQYLLSPDGRMRFNVFRTSNYDAVFSQMIGRQGAGISFRKSFNGLSDFFNVSEQNKGFKKPLSLPAKPQEHEQKPPAADTSVVPNMTIRQPKNED